MSAQRCQCGHYQFAHDKSQGLCDDCRCTEYRHTCAMCDGSGTVQIAEVSTIVDWTNAQHVPCPRCHD